MPFCVLEHCRLLRRRLALFEDRRQLGQHRRRHLLDGLAGLADVQIGLGVEALALAQQAA